MVTFEEAVLRFLSYLKIVKNASEHTTRNYGLDLRRFQEFLSLGAPKDSVVLLSGIEKRGVRSFLASLNAKGTAKKSIHRRLSSLRSFFAYCVKEHLITSSPLDEMESPKLDKRIPSPLTYEQVMHLLEQPDLSSYLGLRDRCIFELLYSSGLRISELVGLNREDVDGCRLRVMGKGRRQRVIPITQTAAGWIFRYLHDPARECRSEEHQPQVDPCAIFLNKWGKRISVRSVDRNFKLYLLRSGLAGSITPHTIRHTIATHWLEKGMDLKTIQLLLGHQSLGTTTIYTQVSSRLKREVYKDTHPLELQRQAQD